MDREAQDSTISSRLIPRDQDGSPSVVGYARQTVLEALDRLERENEEIRSMNTRILSELEELRQENEQLRREAEMNKADRQDARQRIQLLDADNLKLNAEIQRQMNVFAEKERRRVEVEKLLKADNFKFEQMAQDMSGQMANKENEISKISKELYAIRDELQRNDRRNSSEHDIELLHEMEMLRTEKTEVMNEKQSVEKLNNKLRNELRNLEAQLEDKELELKNENRRHSLLTKEFNSLLEENSHLKLQLRRRPAAMTSKDNVSSSEAIVPLNIPADSRSSTARHTPRPCGPMTREKTSLGLSADFSKQTSSRMSQKFRDSSTDIRTMSSEELAGTLRPNRAFLDTLSGRSTRTDDNSSPETLPSLVGSSKKWRP